MHEVGGAGRGVAKWAEKHLRDVRDLAALIASLLMTRLLLGPVPGGLALSALVAAALIPLRGLPGPMSPMREFIAALPRRLLTIVVCAIVLHYFLIKPLRPLWFGASWPLFGFLLAVPWRRTTQRAFIWICGNKWALRPAVQESLRGVFLGSTALWLLRGFARTTLHGADDALWYSMNLADAVGQMRAGAFPMWAGQTPYQFNGSIIAIRVAPAFQYLGALLDEATLRTLGLFTVQNLLITGLGLLAMAAAYLGLCEFLSRRRWLAAGLAVLFLSCPGVLGLCYNEDLYMSWTTVPLIPVVWYATVRSYQDRGSPMTLLILGAALGLSCWGHAPIALWSTVIAAILQAVRLACQGLPGINGRAIVLGAAAFSAIAAYPIGSVLLFPAEPHYHTDSVLLAEAIVIARNLRAEFPASLSPLSADGRSLSDYQLGYALMGVLLVLAWSQRVKPKAVCIAIVLCCAGLAALLLPFNGLEISLWNAVPFFLRNPTGNWPMTRLFLPMSGAIVFGTAAAFSGTPLSDRRRYWVAAIVAVGCVWSLAEAAKFAAGSRRLARDPASAVDLLRPENIELSRYSYGFFPHFADHPSTYTHGVTDPELENHLLSTDMNTQVDSDLKAAARTGRVLETLAFVWTPAGPSQHASLAHPLHIEPERYYVLKFDFERADTLHGVLDFTGPHIFRNYALPDYGGSRSFGAGGTHANLLPIRTTAGPEDVDVSYYPDQPISDPRNPPPIARVQLIEYDRGQLPVRVDGWVPLTARVQSPEPAWLESPRAYQTGYSALVNGEPAAVAETPDCLVAVKVPKGTSSVILAYRAPGGLAALFWLSFLSAAAAVVFGAAKLILHLLRTSAPASPSGFQFNP